MAKSLADPAIMLTVLQAKSLAGYHPANYIQQAEDLAVLGIRASLVAELTGLPLSNATRIAKSVGNAKTGRRKTSLDDIFRTAYSQQQASVFLVMVERQLALNPAPRLLSVHVLDAIRSLCACLPSQREQDWERMVEAAIHLQDGTLSLVTCSACHTRHVVPTGGVSSAGARINETDRSCPLCRIAASSTEIVRTGGTEAVVVSARVRTSTKTVIPTLTADLHERRQRLRAALPSLATQLAQSAGKR
ncbi:hypothetical protein RhoFW510R10_12115 [Rhodanobacter sp. FW510-R10]|nr:hypothetical protein RhoFW510R10_12115 [Rhodanobacter sp. FW510-R10]